MGNDVTWPGHIIFLERLGEKKTRTALFRIHVLGAEYTQKTDAGTLLLLLLLLVLLFAAVVASSYWQRAS